MTRRILALGLLIAGTLALATAPSATAADLEDAAWWSRLATTTPTDEVPAPLPVPAPTLPDTIPQTIDVPEGQFLVQSTPEGATAIAALRWTLAEAESSPSLTLALDPGSTVTPESIVLACRSSVRWTPPAPDPGRWETKPLVDPVRCVNGIVGNDVMSISFGLQPLVSGRTLDVVFVAGRRAELPPEISTDAFRWVFTEPGPDALQVVAGSPFREGDRTPTEGFAPVTTIPPDSSGAPTVGFGAPAVAGPVTRAPSTPSPGGVDAGVPVATPALAPQELAPSVPQLASAPVLPDPDEPLEPLGVVLLLLAMGVAAWSVLGADEDDGERGLGRFRTVGAQGVVVGSASSSPAGGLGRFSRPRSTPAPPLS